MRKILLGLCFLCGCNWSEAMSSKPPVVAPPASGITSIDGIKNLAASSSCAKVSWKDRGNAPIGYVKGMALSFSKSFCKGRASKKDLGAPSADALAYYTINSPDKLVDTYALLIGLGMRESSGQYCEGRDTTAQNVTSETAESGAFQTSWNARVFEKSLPALFAEYQSGNGCQLDIFKEGVSQKHCAAQGGFYGSGDGLAFQKLERSCPLFAAEFAAIVIRTGRGHYGPLNRKEAQFKPECRDMFAQVEAALKAKPDLCSQL